ncbi:MAG: glycosyltransferase family 4 protein [Actinomycetota bacterium]
MSDRLAIAADRLRAAGVGRVESYAWRDLSDPDGGGSEVHADEILARWAAVGIEIVHRTSVPRDGGDAGTLERRGYRIVRRGGRFDVFARVALRQLLRRTPQDTAVLEIWNGVPFLSPLWAGRRRLVWLHHLHRDMWVDALPGPLAAVGRVVESRVAPCAYRRTSVVTLSESSAEELRSVGFRRVEVVPPGIATRFAPAPRRRALAPRVVVVGRLAPVKRQVLALEAVRSARATFPDLEVDLVGDGPDRPSIERWITDHAADDWVHLRGFVDDAELVSCYQRAWLAVSPSKAEGWGMSLTEAAACATPSVATDIAGHRDSVIDGVTGVLVASPTDLAEALVALLGDDERRAAMGAAATEFAREFSWDDVAARQLELLVDTVE